MSVQVTRLTQPSTYFDFINQIKLKFMFCFRFKAIMHPLNQQTSKRTTLALLLMAWFFALALAIPKMMVYKFTIVYDSAYGLKPYCMTKDLEMEWPSFLENLLTSNSTLNSTELISTLKSDSILE